MHSYRIDTTGKLETLLQDEVFQCEEILALGEDTLLADLRYYQQAVHHHGLPAELKQFYQLHIGQIEMLFAGLADCLVSKPDTATAALH